MTCANPECRHPTRRKLRPLVISLIPPSNENNTPTTSSKDNDATSPESAISGGNGNSRHEQITRMFTTHPSLSTHFEPPVFSPGVPQRDLRNRLKLLEHANKAGLIPDVEWEAICRAVREQSLDDTLDPFRYLATSTKIEPSNEDITNDTNNKTDMANKSGKKPRKKKHWLEFQTTSLVPISPHRQGPPEDSSVPYSMELWRKAKTLNRDRSVLACTLAHLMAMKTLVGEREIANSLDGSDGDGGFDFILEDNVRAMVGIESDEKHSIEGSEQWNGWSCECANRIWDAIDASNDAPPQCHMRYYGWLGSLPNLNWIYKNHIPRSAFNSDDAKNRECAVLFPFPTTEDFEQDSIDYTSKSKRQEGGIQPEVCLGEQLKTTKDASSQMPQFTTPGGTAVWGTFAYTISSASYRTLINQLQNDVGSLVWKGKRMRAYLAKPIDKILPRHIKAEFGPSAVHLSDRVAFVRCPMLGSKIHPQWEEGFCSSTEMQHHLSSGHEDINSDSSDCGSDVWDHVWLTSEEVQVVNHRRKSGKWEPSVNGRPTTRHSSRRPRSSVVSSTNMIPMVVLVAIVSLSFSLSVEQHLLSQLLPKHGMVADAFAFNKITRHKNKRPNSPIIMSSSTHEDDRDIVDGRKRDKLGKVPIISRKIPIEIKVPPNLPKNENIEKTGGSVENDVKRLDVTVWEMDKPSDLIQEWWSIDDSERSARVGDPFGVVMWPGSILAAKELMKQHYSSPSKSALTNATVLVLGAGTGVEAQMAALCGAKKVVATDINPLTLKLLEYGAKNDDRIADLVEARYFDMFSSEPLPPCDILVAADVLYNPDLAKQLGRRLHEAIVRSFDEGSPPTKVIITDSQKFHGTNFLDELIEMQELNALFKEGNWEQLKWETQKLESVCGSGVLVDEDQVYDVDARVICWGW